MPCEIFESEKERLSIKISGMLRKAELGRAEQIAVEKMRSGNKIRLLFLIEDFQGWDNRDDWGDVSFQSQYDSQIEKIALVCEKRWQDKAEMFVGKGIRSMEIRIFAPSQVQLAKAWIG
jgi:hypothetical protein